jgi:hypothetical protein
MSDLNFAEAFRRFGAKLHNVQWSVCAENDDKELVVSCWDHLFSKSNNGGIRYSDDLDRWGGPGNAELRRCLDRAFRSGQTIRAVIARAEDPRSIDGGIAGSKVKKRFFVKEDWHGTVVELEGSHVTIEFRRAGDARPRRS